MQLCKLCRFVGGEVVKVGGFRLFDLKWVKDLARSDESKRWRCKSGTDLVPPDTRAEGAGLSALGFI